MARPKVQLDHREMARLLKGEGPYSGVRAELTRRAERVLEAAKADPHDDTGDYERSLHIEQATTDRASVRVAASDWKAHMVEARFGVLSRALDQAGGV